MTARREANADCAKALLQVDDLTVAFGTGRARREVVRGVSFEVAPGECFAIVGESGSGKSVTARTLLGLAGSSSHVSAARLELCEKSVLHNRDRDWRRVRGREVGFVLQDALASLDPLRTVGAAVVAGFSSANHVLTPPCFEHAPCLVFAVE